MNYPTEYYETEYEHKAQLCDMSDIDFKQGASSKIKRAKKERVCRKKRSLIKARKQLIKNIELMIHNINNETRLGG